MRCQSLDGFGVLCWWLAVFGSCWASLKESGGIVCQFWAVLDFWYLPMSPGWSCLRQFNGILGDCLRFLGFKAFSLGQLKLFNGIWWDILSFLVSFGLLIPSNVTWLRLSKAIWPLTFENLSNCLSCLQISNIGFKLYA